MPARCFASARGIFGNAATLVCAASMVHWCGTDLRTAAAVAVAVRLLTMWLDVSLGAVAWIVAGRSARKSLGS